MASGTSVRQQKRTEAKEMAASPILMVTILSQLLKYLIKQGFHWSMMQ